MRKSEFGHLHNGAPIRSDPEHKKNFLNRFTSDTFQKQIPYCEDLYENKDDLTKLDYINRRNLIVEPALPYTTSVKQHGAFYPAYITYGSDKFFPNVINIKPFYLNF